MFALLQWRSKAEDPPIERGIVSFGAGPPGALPQAAGLWLTGRLDSASITDMVDLKWDQPRGRPLSDWLAGADLAIRRLEVLGYEFAGASGRLRPGNRAWEIDVNSEAASGHVVVPYTFPGDVPMVLDLDRLVFGTSVRRPARANPIHASCRRSTWTSAISSTKAASTATCRRNSRAARTA